MRYYYVIIMLLILIKNIIRTISTKIYPKQYRD